jgi:hypothetical protein
MGKTVEMERMVQSVTLARLDHLGEMEKMAKMAMLDLLDGTASQVRQVYKGQKAPAVPQDLFAKVERSPGKTPISPPLIQTTRIDTERRNRSIRKRSRHTTNRVQIAIQITLDTKSRIASHLRIILARNRNTKDIRAPTTTKGLRNGRNMAAPTLTLTHPPLPRRRTVTARKSFHTASISTTVRRTRKITRVQEREGNLEGITHEDFH